jgi:hypothetical protein
MQSENDQAEIDPLAFNQRHGIVGGVEIDLRHESVAPGEWSPTNFGGSPEPVLGAPYLWFPWFGVFDAESLQKEAAKAFAEQSETVERAAFVDQYVRTHTPECIVNKGDKVRIKEVEFVQTGDEFSHPHDRKIAKGHLSIVRANKEIEEIRTPLTFVGTNTILNPTHNAHFQAIVARIRDSFGLISVEDIGSVTKDNSFAYRALQEAHVLWNSGKNEQVRHTPKGKVMVVGPMFASEEFRKGNTSEAVNRAIRLGYLWVKAEFEAIGAPIVDALRAKANRSSEGGKESGRIRLENSERGWRSIARPMLLKTESDHPDWSQEGIFTDVLIKWPDKNPPSLKTLASLFRQMTKGRRDSPNRRSGGIGWDKGRG